MKFRVKMFYRQWFCRKILFFFVLIIPFFSFSQFSFSGNFGKESQLINAIAKSYPDQKNTTELSQFISEQAKILHFSESNNSFKIIKDIFIANKLADLYQNHNNESKKLFLDAIHKSKGEKRKDFYIWTNLYYGNYLYTYRHYKEALPYIVECDQELSKTSENSIFQPEITYKLVSYFLSTAQEYNRSIKYLQKAKKHSTSEVETAAILDNMGLNYLKLNQTAEAENYFNQALIIAQKTNDKLRFAKVLGNIATLKLEQKKYTAAKNLFLHDISISKELKNPQNTMYAQILLSKAYMGLKDFGNAETTLKEAENIAQSKPQFKSSELEIFQLFQKIAENKGDSKNDLAYRKKIDSLTEVLKKLDGRDAIYQINWETQKENLQYQLNSEKAQRDRDSYIIIVIILFSVLLLCIIFYVMKSLRSKWKIEKSEYEKKVLSLALEKEKSENKLNNSEQTIESFKTYIQERNTQIDYLEKEISKINKSSSSYLETKAGDLQKLLDSHLMTQENWEKFKILYRQEYADYYQKMMTYFPDLTESNQRIVILSSLGITNSEMARILGVTVDGIKKAKQRLRKKYNEEIEHYLSPA